MRSGCLRGNPGAVPRMKWKLILRGKTIDIPCNEWGGGRRWRVQRDFVRTSLWLNQSFSTNRVCFPNQDIIEGWSRTINFSVSTALIPGFLFLKPPTSRLKFKCLSGMVLFTFPHSPCRETSCCMLHGACTDLLHFQMEREAQRETEKRKPQDFQPCGQFVYSYGNVWLWGILPVRCCITILCRWESILEENRILCSSQRSGLRENMRMWVG